MKKNIFLLLSLIGSAHFVQASFVRGAGQATLFLATAAGVGALAIKATKSENNLLGMAIESDSILLAKIALSLGAKINGLDNESQFPLIRAISYKNINMIRFLLKFGANPNLRKQDSDKFPLALVIQEITSGKDVKKNTEISAILIKYGAIQGLNNVADSARTSIDSARETINQAKDHLKKGVQTLASYFS